MIEEGRAVDVIYVDFSKAFVKVPRRRLVGKESKVSKPIRFKISSKEGIKGELQRVAFTIWGL